MGTLWIRDRRVARITIHDGAHRAYVETRVATPRRLRFRVRGSAGLHCVTAYDRRGALLQQWTFRLQPATHITCDRGPYGQLATRIQHLLELNQEREPLLINGRLYHMLVPWGRDHVHTLKAQKYFMADVKSGMEYWLETQEKNGMFWDCIHYNPEYPGRTWLGEALGKGYFRYDDGMKYIVRRIPVEADCEFLYTEAVWQIWKATGDDAWMAEQLPRLEKALKYNSSDPTRWSKKWGLVRRSLTMDSWDFVNPLYCHGDHRCINPGDPQFLFHGDNSGLYSSYWRMAEMYEALGNTTRAAVLRREGEALRERANRALFFDPIYAHMLPETLPWDEVFARIGDERQRLSLSISYTINRKLPTHEMAVKILREYQRRRHEKQHESFAEWWTMDPPYTAEQWPPQHTGGSTIGDYMNGAICAIVAGELAKAAFDHGMEDYGVDILERVWQLSERDGGHLHQVYRRVPENPVATPAVFQFVDLRKVANRGLRHGAHPTVPAWTDEGDNDMRNLPTGRQRFGLIEFEIIDPAENNGRAVVFVEPSPDLTSGGVEIPVPCLRGQSIYFLHAMLRNAPHHAVIGAYDVRYADGTQERIFIRKNHEINLWWGISDAPAHHEPDPVDRSTTRVAWRGANGQWANVGMHMFGWNNPFPEKPVVSIRALALPVGGLIVGAISFSDQPVKFEERIRSYGLPDCWSQAAVYYALAEGLCGIEDRGRAFDRVRVAPRWAASKARKAHVTLHYPASDGYCTYHYANDGKGVITLELAGSFHHAEVMCLLPRNTRPVRVILGQRAVPFTVMQIEASTYVTFVLEGIPQEPVKIRYARSRPRRRGQGGVSA
ncbi:MAG: hypothetical protein N2595_06875 [bacterium]|nr:hypothetical protein [bacterium]